MKVTILLSALCMLRGCTTYNILVFLPNPIWSHYVQVEHIIHSLGLRGHNVTVMSPYPTKNGTGNVRHFFLAPETSPAYCKWRTALVENGRAHWYCPINSNHDKLRCDRKMYRDFIDAELSQYYRTKSRNKFGWNFNFIERNFIDMK